MKKREEASVVQGLAMRAMAREGVAVPFLVAGRRGIRADWGACRADREALANVCRAAATA